MLKRLGRNLAEWGAERLWLPLYSYYADLPDLSADLSD